MERLSPECGRVAIPAYPRRHPGSRIRASLLTVLICLAVQGLLFAPEAQAQAHEFAVSLGSLNSGDRSASDGLLEIGRGTALQANYAKRLETSEAADLYLDLHVLEARIGMSPAAFQQQPLISRLST
jgi:hypothetical protein